MKLPVASLDSFTKNPDKKILFALIYGPDSGLALSRVKTLIKAVVGSLDDPFCITNLSYKTLKDDVASFSDELGAMSLTGERRLIRISDTGTQLTKDFSTILESYSGDNFVVFEAGELTPSSSLRKWFEKNDRAAAIPCYKDDVNSMRGIVSSFLRERGYGIDNDALGMLAESLVGDRMVAFNELEKLVLYMDDEKQITYESAVNCVTDQSDITLERVSNAVASRDSKSIEQAIQRALKDGIPPIAIIRSLAIYFIRFDYVLGQEALGQSRKVVIDNLRPPIFFKQRPIFERLLSGWNGPRVGKLLKALMKLELECKQSQSPAELLCSRFLTIVPMACR